MNKKKKIVLSICMVLTALVAVIYITAGLHSTFISIYSHPKAEWKENADGSKYVSTKFSTDEVKAQGLERFQREELGLPFALSWSELIGCGWLLLLVCVILLNAYFDLSDEDERQRLYKFFSLVLGMSMFASIILCYINTNSHDYPAEIRVIITESALADGVIKEYQKSIVERVVGIHALEFLSFVIIFWLYYFLRNILLDEIKEAIANYITNYREEAIQKAIDNEPLFPSLNRNILEMTESKDEIQIVSYSKEIKRIAPFLHAMMPIKDVLATMPIHEFFHLLTNAPVHEILTKFNDSLSNNFNKRMKDTSKSFLKLFIKDMKNDLKKNLPSHLKTLREGKLAVTLTMVQKLIQKIVIGNLRLFKESIAETGAETMAGLLDGYKGALKGKIKKEMDNLFIDSMPQKTTTLLPQNTRFHLMKGNKETFIIEQPPMKRSILVSSGLSGNSNQSRFYVAFPYVVFVVTLENSYLGEFSVFYRHKPLTSLDDRLYKVNLTNTTFDSGSVCLGYDAPSTIMTSGEKVDHVISHFWNSEFNSDGSDGYDYYKSREKKLASFEAWEKASRDDPDFPISINWCEARRLDRVVGDMSDVSSSVGMMYNFVDDYIDKAFTKSDADFKEGMKKMLSAISVQDVVPEKTEQKLKEHEETMIEDVTSAMLGVFETLYDDESSRYLIRFIQDSIGDNLDEDIKKIRSTLDLNIKLNTTQLIKEIKLQNNKSERSN